jgi:ketosteroid isomerase-like protein
MNTTPRQVAESYWRAEESRDVERVLAHFHPDATFHPVTGPLVRIVHEISSGDEAALEWEADLINHEGTRFPICGSNFVKVRDGKFTYVRAYFDPTSFPQPGDE